MQVLRLLAAFIIAPFIGPIIGVAAGDSAMTLSDALVFLYFFTYTSIGILRYFAWLPTLVLSIPMYFVMRRQCQVGWWQLMLAFGVLQALPAVAIAALDPGSGVFNLTCFVEGTLDGAAFRLIAGAAQRT